MATLLKDGDLLDVSVAVADLAIEGLVLGLDQILVRLLEPVLLISGVSVDLVQLNLFVLVEGVHSLPPLNVHERPSVAVLQVLIATCLEDLQALQVSAEGLLAYDAVCLGALPIFVRLEVVSIALVRHVLLQWHHPRLLLVLDLEEAALVKTPQTTLLLRDPLLLGHLIQATIDRKEDEAV